MQAQTQWLTTVPDRRNRGNKRVTAVSAAGVWLQPENTDYKALAVTESLHVWGVATHNLHSLCSR